jgi:hypothetical protein
LNRYWLLRKGAAIAAIFLCGGIAIVPCLSENISKASAENTDVNITIQVCDMRGFRNHTVALAKQHYLDLVQYISDLQAHLNASITEEETITVFKEAVVEFHKYGLLPKGISVEQAQRLVTGQYQQLDMLFHSKYNILHKWITRDDLLMKSTRKNVCCLLSAVATKIPGYVPSPIIIPFSLLLLVVLLPAIFISLMGGQELANTLAGLGLFVWKANPVRVFNIIVINGYEIELRSFGLKGLVHETLPMGGVFKGFSGLMLFPFSDTTIFLGFALSVNGVE